MDHLDQLEAFAECLSVAFESAVLAEKAAQQRIEVDNLHANFDGLLGGAVEPSQVPKSAVQPGHREARRYCPMPAGQSSLTAREQEIMAHVAAGATNGQIARSLVISEGTVKSHLKRIAKKLNTPSRAAAVAVYSGMTGGNSGALR
jgi:DNA-binding CsgD family transcriptional regulator